MVYRETVCISNDINVPASKFNKFTVLNVSIVDKKFTEVRMEERAASCWRSANKRAVNSSNVWSRTSDRCRLTI